MISKIVNPEERTPQEHVAYCLRMCALRIDPLNGYLKDLATELDLHETTLSKWKREGRIPLKAARRLQRRFGKRLVNLHLVSQA